MLIGCPVGKYWQFSNNLHGYLTTTEPLLPLGNLTVSQWVENDPYAQCQVVPHPILSPGETQEQWHQDLQAFMDVGITAIGAVKTKFFRRVVMPIELAHYNYRNGKGEERYTLPIKYLADCQASDWQKACIEWLQRRHAKFVQTQDTGVAHE